MKTIKITDDGKLKTSELFAKVKEKYGKGWSYLSDEELDRQFPPQVTSREFLDEAEPDTATRGLSYNDCLEKGLLDRMMTIREYLLMQLQRDTHSDIKGWTLFSALDSDGSAVHGGWRSDDSSHLGWNSRGGRYAGFGPRVVLTLTPQSSNPSDETQNAIKHLKSQGYKITKEF